MRTILLTRHGQTSWNAVGRLQGHTDTELDDIGRDQARSLATSLAGAGIAHVVTSDLSRAMETGAIVARALALPPPLIEPELRERRFGIFEGLTRDECQTRHPEHWRNWIEQTGAPPGGEARELAIARMARSLAKLAEGDGGPVLAISHGGVMRLWLMEILGATNVPLIPNGTTYVLGHDGSTFTAARR